MLVYQASLLDGLALDAFSVEQDGLAFSEIDVSVTFAPVNDAPELALAGATRAATGEVQAAVIADAAIADGDSPRMGGATITLTGAGADETLIFAGFEIRQADGRALLGKTGIELIHADDGSMTLSGAAPRAVYEGVLEALLLENPTGLAAGIRSIGVTLRHEAGAAGANSVVAVTVEPSVIHGDGTDRVLAGTAGDDTIHASGGNETLVGGKAPTSLW